MERAKTETILLLWPHGRAKLRDDTLWVLGIYSWWWWCNVLWFYTLQNAGRKPSWGKDKSCKLTRPWLYELDEQLGSKRKVLKVAFYSVQMMRLPDVILTPKPESAAVSFNSSPKTGRNWKVGVGVVAVVVVVDVVVVVIVKVNLADINSKNVLIWSNNVFLWGKSCCYTIVGMSSSYWIWSLFLSLPLWKLCNLNWTCSLY